MLHSCWQHVLQATQAWSFAGLYLRQHWSRLLCMGRMAAVLHAPAWGLSAHARFAESSCLDYVLSIFGLQLNDMYNKCAKISQAGRLGTVLTETIWAVKMQQLQLY